MKRTVTHTLQESVRLNEIEFGRVEISDMILLWKVFSECRGLEVCCDMANLGFLK